MAKITDYLSETEILAQLAEEATELAQAALKLRRAIDGTNPTPKSVDECMESFFEEMADVDVCMEALSAFDDMDTKDNSDFYDIKRIEKKERWLKRLKEKEGAGNG